MEKFKSFAAKRILVGIILAIVVLWAGGYMMGFFGDRQPERSSTAHESPAQHTVTAAADPDSDHQPTEHAPAVVPDAENDEHRSAPGGHTAAETHETTSAGTTTHDAPPPASSLAATSSSRAAIETFKARHQDLDQLLYLYATQETPGQVAIAYPGKLLVNPDVSPLEELLSHTQATLEINVTPQAMSDYLNDTRHPALAVLDSAHHLVGIVATDEALAELKSAGNKHAPAADNDTEADAKSPVVAASVGHGGATTHTAASTQAHGVMDSQTHPPASDPSHQGGHETAGHSDTADADEHETTGQAKDAHGGHGAKPAADQPKGVAFITAAISPLEYELKDRFFGWRPNDLVEFTDNVNKFQLGVLEVTRRTAVVLAERMSRTGITASFDPNLENAMNWFMIKPDKYWFPSSESKYLDGLKEWGRYEERLKRGEANFHTRADNLIPLLMVYEDLLGSCEENLVKYSEEDGSPVSFFRADDYMFYTKGVVSAMATILEAVEVDFHGILSSRRALADLHHAIESCHHATHVDPFIVFNSDPSSMLANHRANMAAPLSHARFYMSVLIKTLST